MTRPPSAFPESVRIEAARLLASAEFAAMPAKQRLLAIAALLGAAGGAASRGEAAELLREASFEGVADVLRELTASEIAAAREAYAHRKAGEPLEPRLAELFGALEVPLESGGMELPPRVLGEALSLALDKVFLQDAGDDRVESRGAVEQALALRLASLRGVRWIDGDALARRVLADGGLPAPVETALRGAVGAQQDGDPEAEAAVLAALSHGEAVSFLERLLAAPGWGFVAPLLALCRTERLRERACLLLTLRYGESFAGDFEAWATFLKRGAAGVLGAHALDRHVPPSLLMLVACEAGVAPLHGLGPLLWQEAARLPGIAKPSPEEFIDRWSERIPPREALAIRRGVPVEPDVVAEPLAPSIESAVVSTATVAPQAGDSGPVGPPAPALEIPPPAIASEAAAVQPRVIEEPEPRAPSPWRGFIAENANLLAGVAMLLVGGSLVAYFTWDRHWLFRYTLVPAMFAGFTGALALIANWLERRDAALAGTAAMLRGAAIGLLPVNCMSVSFLAEDPVVGARWLAVPLMASLYFVLMTLGLRRWCSAVHAGLGAILTPALLALNGLVLLRPLAHQIAGMTGLPAAAILVPGFYLGFLLVAWAIRRFSVEVLSREDAREPRIAWFVAATLVASFVQVFGWVHAFEHQWPSLASYGPLVVFAGGLAFYFERQVRLAQGSAARTSEESFIGFALILCGVVASFASPSLRIVSGALAGALWLYQARFRSGTLHTYLGLLFLTLSAAAVSLLDGFPGPATPLLGLAICAAMAGVALFGQQQTLERVAKAAWQLQQALLVLTAVVAVLAHYRFRSAPLPTAAVLLGVSALLLRRAARLTSARDALTGAVVAAVALPYLGFADMQGRDLSGNTLAFGLAGLSLVWLALIHYSGSEPLRQVRSAALLLYGVFALAAMAARVLLQRQIEVPAAWLESVPEYLGPLLILAVLAHTTRLTRSMLPFGIGLVIVVTLLPELKADVHRMFPGLEWGSGFGGALSAVATLALAFHWRSRPPRPLAEPPDLLFDGKPFPLLRDGSAAFTTPLVAATVFLACRVDLYSLARNFAAGPPTKTIVAILLTSVVWTLLGVWWRKSEPEPAAPLAKDAVAIAAGGILLLFGFWLYERRTDPWAVQWPLLWTGLTLWAVESALRFFVAPERPWAIPLLANPYRSWLSLGALLCGTGILGALLGGADETALRALTLFVLIQLLRAGLRIEGALLAGTLAALLLFLSLLAETAGGRGPLLERLSYAHSAWPTLGLALGIQLLGVLLERLSSGARLWPFVLPMRAVSGLAAAVLAVLVLASATEPARIGAVLPLAIAATLLLVARWTATGPLLLLSSVLVYLAALHPSLIRAAEAHARLVALVDPTALSLYALVVAAMLVLAARSTRDWEGLKSPWPVGPALPATPAWLHTPAVLAALAAVARHSMVDELRLSSAALPAPFLAASALFLLASVSGMTAISWCAGSVLALANVHALRLGFGPALRSQGLSEIHLAALGVFAAAAQIAVLRPALGRLVERTQLCRLLLAGTSLVLVLLSANFTSDPDLADITTARLLVSGVLAFASARAFRHLLETSEGLGDVTMFRGVYLYGVSMALWCLVLLVPAFRSPLLALVGLSLPALYFLIRAERAATRSDPGATDYAGSALAIGSGICVLYALRPIFQGVFFPGSQIRYDHYHYNAPLVVLLGAAILRTNAIAPSAWARALGGIAFMTGVYFGVSGVRGWSPFEGRFQAAWLGIVFAHVATRLLIGSRRVAGAVARIGRLAEPELDTAIGGWHFFLGAGAAVLSLAAVLSAQQDTHGACAVLAGAASVWLVRDETSRFVAIPTALLLLAGSLEAVPNPSLLSELGGVAVALVVWSRSRGAFTLAAATSGYLLAQHLELMATATESGRWSVVSAGVPLSLFALSLALLLEAARRKEGAPWIPVASPWLLAPATLLGVLATLRAQPELPERPLELAVGFIAALTHGLLALSPGFEALAYASAGLLALAQFNVIDRFASRAFAEHGLAVLHQAAAALGLTALTMRACRNIRPSFGRAALAAAAILTVLLTANYAARPGLESFTTTRGLLVGLLALGAAIVLSERGRTKGDATRVIEGLQDIAVATSLLAFAFALPALRTPALSLAALLLPALFFLGRAELDRSSGRLASASLSAIAVVALFASPELYRLALHPGVTLGTRHFHTQAVVLILAGLILARQHKHGAPFGIALIGALSLMTGSYFALTAWPGLSPFDSPLRGAWAAIALLHAWTLATTPHASTTGLIKQFAGLLEDPWNRIRTATGLTALIATHLLALVAVADPARDDLAIAPLFLGVASVVAHHGYRRRMSVYYELAAIEALLALHVDFVLPSLLDKHDVVFVLLALRLGLVGLQWARPPAEAVRLGRAAGRAIAFLVLAHVAYHRPWTSEGLIAIGALALTTGLVARRTAEAPGLDEQLVALALFATPTWLVHFSSAPWQSRGVLALFVTEPMLRTLVAAWISAFAARSAPSWALALRPNPARPNAFDQLRALLLARGALLHDLLVPAISLATATIVLAHYGRAYSTVELVLLTALLMGLGVGFYRLGRRRGSWIACFVGEIHGAVAFGVLRRQLLLTTSIWTYEFDLWLALAVSAILTGLKQRLELRAPAPEVQRPITLSLLLLPAAAIYWAVSHHLGTNMVLIVVGLNSVLFAFLGNDRRNSPYNLLAVSGFVSFVLLVFWSKLELRVLHAYVVPVSLGVMLLAQLFSRDLTPATVARLRLFSLSAMLMSAGYHALLDGRYPVAFNLTLLVLCLGAIALGMVLRVRLYATIGLAMLLLDLASLAAKALSGMESRSRMTWVGLGVFVLGALIVAAGVLHRGRQEDIAVFLDRFRRRFEKPGA